VVCGVTQHGAFEKLACQVEDFLAITVGVPRETYPGERRVALNPRACEMLAKAGMQTIIEHSAGEAAGYPDKYYEEHGARVTARTEVFGLAAIVVQVRTLGANPEAGRSDLQLLRRGQILIGLGEPLTAHAQTRELSAAGVAYFALELIPRITRAQSMDVLSSMASIAGYRAVLLAATALPKMFPLMMTAAGTISPAKVLVLGAGVAGLQAIATARRLGGVVSGYDIRPAVREQIESLGAKFVTLELDTSMAEDKGGYAKALDDSQARRQRDLLAAVIADHDVLITTAAVPGRTAPLLVTRDMAERMAPGSVIVDLAAERGGNCELTRAGETVVHHGIQVIGPVNLPSEVAYHASQMYAWNVTAFLKNLVKNDAVQIDLNDEVIRETLVTRDGAIVHARVAEMAGALLAPPPPAAPRVDRVSA
jgi:NAD(P) transhydrogenase subunit alpha